MLTSKKLLLFPTKYCLEHLSVKYHWTGSLWVMQDFDYLERTASVLNSTSRNVGFMRTADGWHMENILQYTASTSRILVVSFLRMTLQKFQQQPLKSNLKTDLTINKRSVLLVELFESRFSHWLFILKIIWYLFQFICACTVINLALKCRGFICYRADLNNVELRSLSP